MSASYTIIDSSFCKDLIAADLVFETLGFTLALVSVGKYSFFSLLSFYSSAKNPAMRGQFCGKVPAKSCSYPATTDNNAEQHIFAGY